MNATKRKFNSLLNGIGNESTTSLSSTDGTLQSGTSTSGETDAQKRRRVNDLNPIIGRTISHLKPTSAPRSSPPIQHKKSTSLSTATLRQETPNYAPWDREEFLKRLKSFSNLTDWTPKPARVNEVEWAKRGWICQKSERVRCGLCKVEILVKLNKKDVDGKEEPVYVAQNIGSSTILPGKYYC